MVRSNLSSRTVALVLAGGQGSRLAPLTDSKPKPAVSLAGTYTLIDIVLSNLSHSGIRNVWIIEQYLGHVLNSYLSSGRPWDLDGTRSGLRIAPPVEGRDQDDSEGFSEGNGHVLFQQLEALEESGANTVIVTSADHLYSLDFRAVLEQHHSTNSDLTIVTTAIEEHPGRYGVVEADDAGRVTSYVYKPEDPAGQIVATEVFIFEVEALAATIRRLLKELDSPSDLGDYGETIIPAMVRDGIVNEYRMGGYWRDLGTIDAYFQAHMDIIDGAVALDDPDWPVITNTTHFSPAYVSSQASVSDSLICSGARVEGAVEHSVIGPGAVVEPGAEVHRSIINAGVVVPAGAVLHSVIADTGATVAACPLGETKPGPGNITVCSPETTTTP